jgi:2-amino-4-hydroxy-6-hydroxymethyldihydropteridine diphosphokinase
LASLAWIALGSNIEPEKNLLGAVDRLHEIGDILRCSNVYQTPAIARTPQADYLNAAVLVETELAPLQIYEQLRAIESDLGRVRTSDKYAARTIDLDLCIYDDLVMDMPEITLPDPDLLDRPFLAVTMAELDPDTVHPHSRETLAEISHRLRPFGEMTLRNDVVLSKDE